MENDNSLHIITNNIKGIQNKNKRLSIIEYFKNKIAQNGILLKENGKKNSVDLCFIHMVLLNLVVY